MNHEEFIRLAMEEAELAVKEGNAPFAVVVIDSDGNVIAKDHDRVKELMDPIAHGEVNVIRRLCKQLNTLDLSPYIFYTTSEPCPTCLTSCIKAKVKTIYYGAETEASASLPIKATYLASQSKKYPITVIGGTLADECLTQRERLFKLN
jgi:tRNA(adenine34) deaminase